MFQKSSEYWDPLLVQRFTENNSKHSTFDSENEWLRNATNFVDNFPAILLHGRLRGGVSKR